VSAPLFLPVTVTGSDGEPCGLWLNASHIVSFRPEGTGCAIKLSDDQLIFTREPPDGLLRWLMPNWRVAPPPRPAPAPPPTDLRGA
jgi:hypothetical protein